LSVRHEHSNHVMVAGKSGSRAPSIDSWGGWEKSSRPWTEWTWATWETKVRYKATHLHIFASAHMVPSTSEKKKCHFRLWIKRYTLDYTSLLWSPVKNAHLKLLTSLSNTPTLLFHILPSSCDCPFPRLPFPARFLHFNPHSCFWKKSSRHQSNVVHEPSEVHTILHLAQLPLADPEGSGPATAPPPRWALPLLYSWIPGQETPRGVRREGKITGSPLSLPLFSLLFVSFWANL